MTVIRPNSVSGITSITAQANEINVFRSNGLLAGLNLNGVNFNTTAGISTLAALKITGNLDVEGVLTYQDVTNVDSLGIGTFRTGINVSGGQLDVGSNIKLGNAGVVTATSFVGALPISNDANNRIITATGSGGLNGESGLTFDGAELDLNNSGGSARLYLVSGNSADSSIYFGRQNDGATGGIRYEHTDDSLQFMGYNNSEKLRITSIGTVGINTTNTGGNGLGVAVDSNNTNPLATGAIAINLKNTNTTDNSWVSMDFNNSVGGIVGRFGAQFKDTSDKNTDLYFATRANGGALEERLRITSDGVMETGLKEITGGNNLAIQSFAVKGKWTGAPSIGKSIELISGYDSAVKMTAVGYNLTDTNTGSTYGGDLTFHTQPLYSSPTTPLPVRMRISSSGYVTKPSQPAWHAWGANQWTSYSGSDNLVTFPYSDTNIGSHYKTSGSDAGKFVCPVAGTYFFYCTIYSGRSDNSTSDGSDYMAINFFSDSNNLANKGGHHIAHYYNEGDRDSTRTLSYVKNCSVGEKLYVTVSCNGTNFQIYGGHSAFGGYLLG